MDHLVQPGRIDGPMEYVSQTLAAIRFDLATARRWRLFRRRRKRKKPNHPQDPTAGLCLGPYSGPRGCLFSRQRGTPATTARVLLRELALPAHEKTTTQSQFSTPAAHVAGSG